MAGPGHPGHKWSRPAKEEEEEEEEDPVDAMVARTGCAAQHYAVQECMAAQQDWRRCQGSSPPGRPKLPEMLRSPRRGSSALDGHPRDHGALQ
nr:PREDICTED: cytochrome c oxidase assembly factor 4 homolog, mitochondrial [Struthio camelus australis]